MGKIKWEVLGADRWMGNYITWTNDEMEGRMSGWRVVWITLVKGWIVVWITLVKGWRTGWMERIMD
jgi:hypothetical protein